MTQTSPTTTSDPVARDPLSGGYDAVIVGAGFAGLYMLYRLRELGMTAQVFEAGDGVGGTWYWNRYPGARAATRRAWRTRIRFRRSWSRSGSGPSATRRRPEILSYIEHVAERFDLNRDIEFNTRVTAAPLRRSGQCVGPYRPIVGTS